MDRKDWTKIRYFPSLHKISYRIIALLQTFHKCISTKQLRFIYFHFQTPHDSCASHYPVWLACPLAHLLFSWLPFLHNIYLVACWYVLMRWEHASSDTVGLEVYSLENHSLVGFPLNTMIPLSFVVVIFCFSIIISSWALLFSCGVKYLIKIG